MSGSPLKTICQLLVLTVVFFSACKSGTLNVFKALSPHEAYQRKLVNSGLDMTAMGKTWIDISEKVLQTPTTIDIPYLEKGYFSPESVQAAAFSFNMQRGQKLNVKLNKRSLQDFVIYTDVWQRGEDGSFKIWGSSDTLGGVLEGEVDQTGTYILRLQPELLAGGEYTLEITTGPSLAYPLKTYKDNQIRSFWGDGRDADSRKHEGIDIFSAFRTPVLASAPGIAMLSENKLGGKVVWLRTEGRDFSLYYAHLDEQLVPDGQVVKPGDTLGLMGNTGNARSTPPHLHFGIYTREGAIDPLPFVNPETPAVKPVSSDTSLITAILRTSGNTSINVSGTSSAVRLKSGTIVKTRAAVSNSYRVELPDGTTGYLAASRLSETVRPIEKQKVNAGRLDLYDNPDTSAAVKLRLREGQKVDVLGNFNEFLLIRSGTETGWIK
jgi:hypothetical protein